MEKIERKKDQKSTSSTKSLRLKIEKVQIEWVEIKKGHKRNSGCECRKESSFRYWQSQKHEAFVICGLNIFGFDYSLTEKQGKTANNN